MRFSDYIIYVDESGDHSLESIDADYPLFVLSFCIFKKSEYVAQTVPALQQFKFRWFGHDLVILHENEIVKKKTPFAFLQFDRLRERFMGELTEIMASVPMTIITAVIRKEQLTRRYTRPQNPYQLALLFCLEKAHEFLSAQGVTDGTTHVVCEARSPKEKGGIGKEDRELELEFRRIIAGRHMLQAHDGSGAMPNFDIVFAPKLVNSTGLQIADLVARPFGLSILRPGQANRAYDVILQKVWAGPTGQTRLYGLKVFP